MSWLPQVMGALLIVAGIGQVLLREWQKTIHARDVRDQMRKHGLPPTPGDLKKFSRSTSLFNFSLLRWQFRTSNSGIVLIAIGALLLGLSPFMSRISN